MKLLIVVVCILAGVSARLNADELAKKYQQVIATYHQESLLKGSAEDRSAHYQSFKQHSNEIEDHNELDGSEWTAGYNEFTSETDEERAAHTGLNISMMVEDRVVRAPSAPPMPTNRVLMKRADTVNYVSFLPGIKNQGSCGSCWTFGAVAPLEYQVNRGYSTDEVRSLSEQQYLDCVYEGSRDGCNGGWPATCYTWSKNNGNLLALKSNYEYTATDSTCITDVANGINGFSISGTTYLSKSDSDLLAATMDSSIGVLSVAIGVISSFYNYESGVYSDSGCSSINHAVDIVGYGTEGSVGYFRVRNSWGTYWGDDGYINMKRGLNGANINTCAIANYAHYPVVTGERSDDGGEEDSDDGDNGDEDEDEEGDDRCGNGLIYCNSCVNDDGSTGCCKHEHMCDDEEEEEDDCEDHPTYAEYCEYWKNQGYCDTGSYTSFMATYCTETCGKCEGDDDDDEEEEEEETTEAPTEFNYTCTWQKKELKKLKGRLTSGWLTMEEAEAQCEENTACAGISCKSKNKCFLNSKDKKKDNTKYDAYICKRK